MSLNPRRGREPLPDALRALALIGVLVVNAAGYQTAPWGPLLGQPAASDSAAAWVVHGLIAFLFQGKAYPLLAFLFGIGLVLASRGRGGSKARSATRLRRLLQLGVLHGVLLYFGDILTLYALSGMLVLRHVHEPFSRLRPRLRRALVWAVGATLGYALVSSVWLESAHAYASEPTLGGAQTWGEFLITNASAYAAVQMGALLLFLPVVRLLMLAGIAAGRLRLLSHPRWRRALELVTRRLLWPALAVNAAYALFVTWAVAVDSALYAALSALSPLIGTPLSMALGAWAAGTQRRGSCAWCTALAPLGQRTLSLYIGHSILCALLFSGAGWGWRAGGVELLHFSLLLWVTAWALSLWAATRGWRGPLEAWMARR